MKKIICFILALCLVFLCSCGKKGNDSSNLSTPSAIDDSLVAKQFGLLYCIGDSINPYLAETAANRQLSSLLYDPLVRLTPDFQPEYVLANTIEQSGKECIITIKSTNFSDGSPVTAEDVVYSYKLATASNTVYSSSLKNISSFTAENSTTIKVTTKKVDPYFTNTLDFPVIKSGSDKLTDENKIALPPIGSGRYIPNFSNFKLNSNPNHIMGAPNISVINLINAPDNEVAKYNLETGNVSVYHSDLSDGTIPPMSGNISTVSLNHLVYLGVNMNKKVLNDEEFRYALSSAISREDICNNVYHSYATAANGIFNPVWNDANGLQNISSKANEQIMVAYLGSLGYNTKDEEGFLVNKNQKRLSFTLVYFSGNTRRAEASALIAKQLRAVGIEIIEKSLEWGDYVSALENGRFDLYIAEVKLLNNMDITELVTPGKSLAYGIPYINPETENKKTGATDTTETATPRLQEQEETDLETETEQEFNTALSVKGFYNEELSLIDIINAFNAEMPLIPICYPLGLTISDISLSANNVSSVSDAYFGISNIR